MSVPKILKLRYPAPSEVAVTPTSSVLRLSLGGPGEVGVRGRVKDPELLRDALLVAGQIRESDLRYRGKDRTAYLAYLMKQGKKATAAIWSAQKAYLEGAYDEQAKPQRGLDPVLTVDPDEVSIEVFSRDESAYARLAFDNALFDERQAAHGSACLDLEPAVLEQIERVRTYQPTRLEASTSSTGTPKERDVDLDPAWMRGFLQVQSAATLASTSAAFAPVDLYNLLVALRLRRAKSAPRGLRFELVPGSRPRIVVEPWEILLEGHGPVYEGPPRIVRIFGRQRLLSLARVVPHLQAFRIHLLAPGLPSFWSLDLGHARLTLAMSGWTESSWATATSFDALMPKRSDPALVDRVVHALRAHGPRSFEALVAGVDAPRDAVRTALQRGALQGRLLFDVERSLFRPRSLLAEPVDEEAIRYASVREAAAFRLLGDGSEAQGEVKLTKHHVKHGEGTELTGEVHDKAASRTFSPRISLDTEGTVREAWCSCTTYQRSGMREGPCEHMLALQIFVARRVAESERLRTTREGRATIEAETRTLLRRDGSGRQTTYRVSLDHKIIRLEWTEARAGRPASEPRRQRMWFDTDHEAREAYFARLDELVQEGFVDAASL